MGILLVVAPFLRGQDATPTDVSAEIELVPGSTAVMRVDENFRSEPNGTVIGRVVSGTGLLLEERQGDWVRGVLRGFVWLPSLQIRADGEFDLAVSQAGGENLRDEPSGRIAARLSEGTLLEEVARIPGWIEVERSGWIWAPSVDLPAPATPAPIAAGSAAVARVAPAPVGPTVTAPTPDLVVDGWLRSGGSGAAILSSPDGDTLARSRPESELRVVAREGNWVRVQLDGWVWVPMQAALLADSTPPAAVDAPAVTRVGVSQLAANFEELRGRLVQLELQFISLERAEQIRTDFYPGEPFLLTRSMEGDRAFVYVAVPPEKVAELGALVPLETLRVVGRARTAAAAFTGSPIVDLVELERAR